MGDTVRKTPCPSCPYRRDVPSGVWSAAEYDKLPAYDGEIQDQVASGAFAPFGCHQADGQLCAGWAGHRDQPGDLLAVRIGISRGSVDPSAVDYRTSVPLFSSGAEAAEHGKREIAEPGERASQVQAKITRVRDARGEPVGYS
jgi:hypothetical protein